MGVVTTKVADSLCSAAPMDQCACKCFHEAQWTCEGSSVVCKAKFGIGELKTVGDKVCETRGAPKPASIAELRVASSCEPVTEMRGSAPTAQCLAQWAKPAPVEETEQHAGPGGEGGQGEGSPIDRRVFCGYRCARRPGPLRLDRKRLRLKCYFVSRSGAEIQLSERLLGVQQVENCW